MKEKYLEIYRSTLILLEKAKEDAGAFKKNAVIEPEEKTLLGQLLELEFLLDEDNLTAASWITSCIEDALSYNYWSDIPRTYFSLLYTCILPLKCVALYFIL